MSGSWKQWSGGVLLGVVIPLVAGCDRLATGPGAEQREANFMSGQNFAIQGQKEKAIASFEQAVLVNPSNASAHLALGDLYYGQLEFINAAYHYNRYLQLLERRGQKVDISAADNLRNCEMQLAVKFSRELSRQQNDLEIDTLRRQIAEKDSLIQRLQSELLQRSPTNELAQANPPAGNTRTATTAEPVTATTPAGGGATSTGEVSRPAITSTKPTPPGTADKVRPASGRTHVVRPGETPSVIARRYGITAKALMAANPGLNANRIKAGTVLKLP